MKALLHKIRVILSLNKRNINILLGQLYAIYVAMNANEAQFPSPVVALATFFALWQAASAAQQLAQTKAPGAVAARGPEIAAVLNAAESLRAYVESLCVTLTSEQAAALAVAAGMRLAALPAHHKPALQANRGAVSGVVVLIANALLRVEPGRLPHRALIPSPPSRPSRGRAERRAPFLFCGGEAAAAR